MARRAASDKGGFKTIVSSLSAPSPSTMTVSSPPRLQKSHLAASTSHTVEQMSNVPLSSTRTSNSLWCVRVKISLVRFAVDAGRLWLELEPQLVVAICPHDLEHVAIPAVCITVLVVPDAHIAHV